MLFFHENGLGYRNPKEKGCTNDAVKYEILILNFSQKHISTLAAQLHCNLCANASKENQQEWTVGGYCDRRQPGRFDQPMQLFWITVTIMDDKIT